MDRVSRVTIKDSEIRVEWDALETEFAIGQAIIDARELVGFT